MASLTFPDDARRYSGRRHMQASTRTYPLKALIRLLVPFTMLMHLAACEGSDGRASNPVPMPEVATVTIDPRQVDLTVELPGRTQAYRVAEIRPQVNGIIQKRFFEEGMSVKAGRLLYRIDPAPFRATLDSAEASLAKAKANMPPIRSKAERYRKLLTQHAISQQAYDDVAAALEEAKADIGYWKAQVEKARINLRYTRVTAPISGRISRSRVTDGALVTAYQAMALATIQQLDPIYVDVTQSTAELLELKQSLQCGRIRTNGKDIKKVQIILEDGSPYSLKGTLKLRDVTSVDPATGSYIIRIMVPNPDYLLLPGMYVRAVVKEGTAKQAILVPQQGVTRNPKGEAMAWIVDDQNTVQQRRLTIDRAIGNQWLVTSGLSGGERVIIEGRLNTRPGKKVNEVCFRANRSGQKPAGTRP